MILSNVLRSLAAPFRGLVIVIGALACGDAQCVIYPCPLQIGLVLSVGAPNAPNGIAGLVVIVNRNTISGSCNNGAVTTCNATGGPGPYHVEVSAPGYVGQTKDINVSGTDAGCNTCGHIDTQHVTMTLQPSA